MKRQFAYLVATSVYALLITNVVADKNKKPAPKKETSHHSHAASCDDVKNLREQVCELMKKIDRLEQGPAIKEQQIVTHTPDTNIRVKISGQVNRAAWWADNGRHSNTQFVDNDNASSRLTIDGSGDFNKDLTVGGIFEVEMLQNSTRNTDIRNASTANASFTTRKSEVYFASKTFGTLYLGKGQMESYLTMYATDVSRTDVALEGAKVRDMANFVSFYDSTHPVVNFSDAVANSVSGTTNVFRVGNVFDDCDGLNRRDRIRYTSPAYGGFTIGGSHAYNTNNDMWDTVIKFEGKFDETLVRAQVAYVEDHTIPIFAASNGQTIPGAQVSTVAYQQINGSAGVLLPCGVSFMLAAAHRDWKKYSARDGRVWFGKVGYQYMFCEAGLTAFAVDYGHFDNFIIDTTSPATVRQKHKGKVYGAGFVQFLDRIATELYIVGRRYTLDVPGGDSYKDVNVVMGGARVKF